MSSPFNHFFILRITFRFKVGNEPVQKNLDPLSVAAVAYIQIVHKFMKLGASGCWHLASITKYMELPPPPRVVDNQ